MSNIYKFHHVVGSNIKKTYTFNNDTQSQDKNTFIYEDDMVINIKHKLSSLFDNFFFLSWCKPYNQRRDEVQASPDYIGCR